MSTTANMSLFKKLLRNKGAVFALVVISLSLIIAITAYWWAPDASPNANRIIVEIGGKKPGFSLDFLLVPIPNKTIEKSAFFGTTDAYQYVPIHSYQLLRDSIVVNKYVDDDTGIVQKYVLQQKGGTLSKASIVHKTFYLGTDKFGRDILSRLLIGTRVSLSVGLMTVLVSLSLGLFLGAIAGYFGGRTDAIVMWFINVIWSIPTLLLVFALTLLLGKGFWQVLLAIGLTLWVNIARLVRTQMQSARELEYVNAAKVLGYSSMRTIWKHIIPNIMGPVWVVVAANFATAIVIEAGLSFLGIGVQPPQPSWGLMIKENYNYIITNNPFLALIPGFAIMLLVLSFNLLGNGLRDSLDKKG